MAVLDYFQEALDLRDQQVTQRLADQLVRHQNDDGIAEIVAFIQGKPSIPLLGQALKTLELVTQKAPALVRTAFPVVFPLLWHSENQIVWRAMTVVANLAPFHTKRLYEELPALLEIMDSGTVITRDHGFKLLLCLYAVYSEQLAPILFDQLLRAPDNQLGQYAEKWLACIQLTDLPVLVSALEQRQPELTAPSHQKRLTGVLKKCYRRLRQ